jgi:hypothetical protein
MKAVKKAEGEALLTAANFTEKQLELLREYAARSFVPGGAPIQEALLWLVTDALFYFPKIHHMGRAVVHYWMDEGFALRDVWGYLRADDRMQHHIDWLKKIEAVTPLPRERSTPKALTSRPPLERFKKIKAAILSGKPVTATTLAKELEVSPKSIHRDLTFLRDRLDVPIEYDAPSGTWRVMPGESLKEII